MHRRPFEGRHLVDQWKGVHEQALQHGEPKDLIFFSKQVEIEFWLVLKSLYLRQYHSYSSGVSAVLSVSAVMFCKQFLAYTVRINSFVFLWYP